MSDLDQFSSPGSFALNRLFRFQGQNRFPLFGRSHNGQRFIRTKRGSTKTRHPNGAALIQATALFQAVEDRFEFSPIQHKTSARPVQAESKRGEWRIGKDFILAAARLDSICA